MTEWGGKVKLAESSLTSPPPCLPGSRAGWPTEHDAGESGGPRCRHPPLLPTPAGGPVLTGASATFPPVCGVRSGSQSQPEVGEMPSHRSLQPGIGLGSNVHATTQCPHCVCVTCEDFLPGGRQTQLVLRLSRSRPLC